MFFLYHEDLDELRNVFYECQSLSFYYCDFNSDIYRFKLFILNLRKVRKMRKHLTNLWKSPFHVVSKNPLNVFESEKDISKVVCSELSSKLFWSEPSWSWNILVQFECKQTNERLLRFVEMCMCMCILYVWVRCTCLLKFKMLINIVRLKKGGKRSLQQHTYTTHSCNIVKDSTSHCPKGPTSMMQE